MNGEIVRLLHGDDEEPRQAQPADPPAWWLDYMEGERDRTIARLRQIDRILIDGGRLRAETLSRRIR